MIIYLVRHGETEWNATGKFQGREDIPLNDNGIVQAGELASRFAGNDVNDVNDVNDIKDVKDVKDVQLIVTSPLMRARQTADIIGRLFPEAGRRIDERLIERDLGGLSGLTKPERLKLREKGPVMDMEPLSDVMKRMYRALCDSTGDSQISDNKIRDRQYAAADMICRGIGEGTTDAAVKDTMMYGGSWHLDPSEISFEPVMLSDEEKKGPCVILVSHGAAINALLSLLSGGNIGSGRTVLRNTAISIVREDRDGFHIMDYDRTDKI